MWGTIANIFLNIYSRWADRPVVRINVKHLEYDLVRNAPDSVLVVITPYPSRYYAEIEFSHRGKATTIKNLILTVNGDLNLDAASFKPIKLQHGDFQKQVVTFPVEENLAVREGTFEIQAIDAFEKVADRFRGRFPIMPTV